MTLLAFDGRMGAAGDMLLGALLAAGADPDALAPVEAGLGVTYAVSTVDRNGIAATSVDVLLDDSDGGSGRVDGPAGERLEDGEPAEGADRDHQHAGHDDVHADHDRSHPDHDHGHPDHAHHGSGDAPDHAEGAGPSRTYPAVVDLVESMDLPPAVEADALAVFERLAEAEAAVHGTEPADTHFHEVGADDAVADVVGTTLLLGDIDPDRVVTTPLATGGGEVETSHGRYPVPAPAVLELAERADWTLRGGPVEAELLTPTGAAILAHVAEGVDALPPMRVRSSGYGAGDRSFAEHPNVLRAVVGDSAGGLRREGVRVLETNVDDVSPEVLGGLHDALAETGALDVSVVPLTMKKSRPGHLVRVVVAPEDAEAVARRLAAETGTLGVREAGARHRWVADREVRLATVELGGESHEVGVKVATDAAGDVLDVSAEYDDAARVAAATGRPVREVMRLAEAALRES